MIEQKKRKRVRTRDVVAEGLYIASAATRLKLKNAILVHILALGEDFHPNEYLDDARAALTALAEEAEEDAAERGREWRLARTRHSDSGGTHDYRARDVRNLRRREKQSLHVASELRRRVDDEDELYKLIADARDAAWTEVAGNIDRTLRIEAARPDLEPDYARMRTARMQALALVDLPKLRAHRRSVTAQQQLRERGELPDIILDGALASGEVDPGEFE